MIRVLVIVSCQDIAAEGLQGTKTSSIPLDIYDRDQ